MRTVVGRVNGNVGRGQRSVKQDPALRHFLDDPGANVTPFTLSSRMIAESGNHGRRIMLRRRSGRAFAILALGALALVALSGAAAAGGAKPVPRHAGAAPPATTRSSAPSAAASPTTRPKAPPTTKPAPSTTKPPSEATTPPPSPPSPPVPPAPRGAKGAKTPKTPKTSTNGEGVVSEAAVPATTPGAHRSHRRHVDLGSHRLRHRSRSSLPRPRRSRGPRLRQPRCPRRRPTPRRLPRTPFRHHLVKARWRPGWLRLQARAP